MENNFHIWMEGYAATGEHGPAQNISKELFPDGIKANSFDEAVEKYMKAHPKHGIEDRGIQQEPEIKNPLYKEMTNYRKRPRFAIWACGLFDNEIDARKSFG